MNNALPKQGGVTRSRTTTPSSRNSSKSLGDRGEIVATEFLVDRGIQPLARNVQFPCGEIDVIALDGDEVVFVEVKSRSGAAFGGAEAVSAAKFRRMRRAAVQWLLESGVRGYRSIRFDVIVVMLARGEVSSIDHYEGVDHGAS